MSGKTLRMESLDRPYGDHEDDYITIDPEGPPAETGEGTGDLVRDEEAAAAAEARAIGGVVADDDVSTPDDEHLRRPEAFEAVEQAGGGQAEGFEQSEELLVEHAGNAPEPELTLDAFDLADPGTDVDPDAADSVAKELSDADRDEEGTLAQPRDREFDDATDAGEGDEVHSSEVTFDPNAGPDDPGRGVGIPWER